jgi:hypothetical protein
LLFCAGGFKAGVIELDAGIAGRIAMKSRGRPKVS